MRGPTRGQRGQAIVEMALVTPLLVVLLLVAADLGRAYHQQVAVVSAARVAAQRAADSTHSGDDSDVVHVANQEASGALSTLNVSVTPPGPRGAGTDVVVTVTAAFTPLTPLVGDLVGGSITLTGVATARSY